MKTKNLISGTILLLIIIYLIYYINNNLQNFKQLTITNPLYLIPLIVILFIFLYSNGIMLKFLMKPFQIKLKNNEAFGLAIITNFYNLITPFRGGAAARAIYLKKKHDFPYVNFLATLSAIYILIFLVSSLIGIFSMLTLIEKSYPILLALSIFTIFLLSIIIFSPKIKENNNKWSNRFIKVINGWHLIKNNKKIITITIIISLIQVFLIALNNLLAYNIFGIEITLAKALFIAAISNLSIIIAITPGNLGIGDAINVFTANIIGIPLTEAIAATILLRAVNLIIIFILGPIYSYKLIKKND
jgi:glycosyltransferase 2 family protein